MNKFWDGMAYAGLAVTYTSATFFLFGSLIIIIQLLLHA